MVDVIYYENGDREIALGEDGDILRREIEELLGDEYVDVFDELIESVVDKAEEGLISNSKKISTAGIEYKYDAALDALDRAKDVLNDAIESYNCVKGLRFMLIGLRNMISNTINEIEN